MEFRGIFIKFGQEEHLLDLQKKGLVHCKTIQYFAKQEDQEALRGDAYENVVKINNIEDLILEIKLPNKPTSEFKKVAYLNKAKFLTNRADEFGNLFCLYSLNFLEKELGEIFTIDERNKRFGSHFLLITNPVEFINRLKKSLIEKGYEFELKFMEYHDFSIWNGEKSVFQKNVSYDYQNEFRIFIHNTTNETIEIQIGDLSDITVLYPANSLEKVRFKAESLVLKHN